MDHIKSWSRERRVIAKAEWMPGRGEDGANPRFVVTSLPASQIEARPLYERLYCARGDVENRIEECQLDLFADRTSRHTMRANQLRLWFAAMAHVLLAALRRIALAHTASPQPPAARSASSCSRSAPRFASVPGASASPWPQDVPTQPSSPALTPDYVPDPETQDPSPSRQQSRTRSSLHRTSAATATHARSHNTHSKAPRQTHPPLQMDQRYALVRNPG